MSGPALSAAFTPPTLDAAGKIAAVHIVVVGDLGRAEIWQTSQTPPKLVTELKGHESDAEVTWVECWPHATRISRDGRVGVTRDKWRIVTASGEPSARVWNMDGAQMTKVSITSGPDDGIDWDVLWAGFTIDGKNIITASASTADPVEMAPDPAHVTTRLGWLQTWDSSTGQGTLEVQADGAWALTEKRIDGLLAARAMPIYGGPVRIYTVSLGERDRNVRGADGATTYSTYRERIEQWTVSPWRGKNRIDDGAELVLGGAAAAGDAEQAINQITMSTVNDLMAVSFDTGRVVVYRLVAGTWQRKAVLKNGGNKGVLAADFAPSDPAYLATASADGRVRIWGWQHQPGGPLAVLDGPDPGAVTVNDVRFRWDGRQFVTANEDGTARVYERRDGTSSTPKWGSWALVNEVPAT